MRVTERSKLGGKAPPNVAVCRRKAETTLAHATT